MIARIVLFDLDDVLIHPGGYRKAFRETMRFFYARMGAAERAPDDALSERLEANGITSEWDMVPLCLAVQFEDIFARSQDYRVLLDLNQALNWARQHRQYIFPLNYAELIDYLAPKIIRDKETATLPAWVSLKRHARGLLPCLADQPVFENLMGHNRHIERSWTMRVFQTFLLGDRLYHKTFGLPPEVQASSSLEECDQPLLQAGLVKRLMDLIASDEIRPAVFTARPSLAPQGTQPANGCYSPEAETAVRFLGLEGVPIIGYGKLVYLGAETGCTADNLLKPSPVHALAAIAAAWTKEELAALRWAYHFFSLNDDRAEMAIQYWGKLAQIGLPLEAEVHVFEDSFNGMLSAGRAVDLINRNGGAYRLHKWGIGCPNSKAPALEALGATVFLDGNDAIRSAFDLMD